MASPVPGLSNIFPLGSLLCKSLISPKDGELREKAGYEEDDTETRTDRRDEEIRETGSFTPKTMEQNERQGSEETSEDFRKAHPEDREEREERKEVREVIDATA